MYFGISYKLKKIIENVLLTHTAINSPCLTCSANNAQR